MPKMMTNTPVVMCISSHDPSGGAGISADIETLASLGCHCSPVISRLSTLYKSTISASQVTDSGLIIEQVRAVLEDMNVDAIKISDLASLSNVEAISTILNDYPNIPVVLHPMLSNSNNKQLDHAIRNLLLPSVKLMILNKSDALLLGPGADTESACAQALMEYGCENILFTDALATTTSGQQTHNRWYSLHHFSKLYSWQRLPDQFQGSGSTLSAALCAYLAHGISLDESIQQAQQFTWQSLQKARRIGMGNLLPDRMHWCRE